MEHRYIKRTLSVFKGVAEFEVWDTKKKVVVCVCPLDVGAEYVATALNHANAMPELDENGMSASGLKFLEVLGRVKECAKRTFLEIHEGLSDIESFQGPEGIEVLRVHLDTLENIVNSLSEKLEVMIRTGNAQ